MGHLGVDPFPFKAPSFDHGELFKSLLITLQMEIQGGLSRLIGVFSPQKPIPKKCFDKTVGYLSANFMWGLGLRGPSALQKKT